MTTALPEPFTAPEASLTPGLITQAELATICRLDAIPADRVAYATMVIDLASDLIRDEARHKEWVGSGGDGVTTVDVPFKAKLICLLVSKRAYQNPKMVKSEGGVGPIGGDTFADAFAAGLELTEVEKADLQAMRGVDGTGDPNGLWIMTNSGGPPEVTTGYVFDSSGSDWAIPYIDFPSSDAMTDPTVDQVV